MVLVSCVSVTAGGESAGIDKGEAVCVFATGEDDEEIEITGACEVDCMEIEGEIEKTRF